MKQKSNVTGIRLFKSPATAKFFQIGCLGFLGGLGLIPGWELKMLRSNPTLPTGRSAAGRRPALRTLNTHRGEAAWLLFERPASLRI